CRQTRHADRSGSVPVRHPVGCRRPSPRCVLAHAAAVGRHDRRAGSRHRLARITPNGNSYMDWTWVWIPATLAAAAAQAGRNAVQRSLTASLGTLGATQVRFLFGFPFALLFLAVVLWADGGPLPRGGLD